MAKQPLTAGDVVNLNLIFANVRCLSELMHTVPAHRHQLKMYFKELFDCVKKYEAALIKFAEYDEAALAQQEEVYNQLMEVTYTIRQIVLKNEAPTDNSTTRSSVDELQQGRDQAISTIVSERTA